MSDFDLYGELPHGTVVLEASAGTGKTFTIAGLVTRYLAEGVARIDELLVVTFGRAATQELRDRVRERLVRARDGLREPAAARAGGDDLLRLLADTDDDEVARRRQRLVEALAAFDTATVATVHEFCQRVLVTLGVAGDVDPDATLVERFDDLVDETVDDLYLRKWAAAGSPVLGIDEARRLARTVVDDVQAVLVPRPADGDDSAAAVRWRFATAVRIEVERRKRRAHVLGFDDWLTRLRRTLDDPQTGPAARARLRERYRIVLVDEFQDTDPVQWDILRLAFHGDATLVLIGDPKQAIYAFRGADVHAYLAATEVADRVASLSRNWRSDPDLLHGLDLVFRGGVLGDPRIAVAPVVAAHPGRCLDGDDPPVRLRMVAKGDRQTFPVKAAREAVLRDLVGEVVTLLERAPLLHPRDGSPPRPLCPGDLAVIVRTNDQLDLVHRALTAAGVPSVQRSHRSVFRTAAAADWLILLDALEQPHRSARIRRLALTPFVGWDAARLVAADVDRLALRVRHWLHRYAERGVAALFETISRDERLAARLLGEVDGERRLTDLRHVAEALHAVSSADGLGLTATVEWLRRRVAESADDAALERSRRLESDAQAVQLVTIWASKGLEFPVVAVPFEWDRNVRDDDVPLFHQDGAAPESAAGGTTRRVRNVGGPGAGTFTDAQRRGRAEQLGESLRLLYVALTRAQSQVLLWWAPNRTNTPYAPLHRLLFTATPADGVPDDVGVPDDTAALRRAAELADGRCLAVTRAGESRPGRWRPPGTGTGALSAAVLGRTVDTEWRRSSYTALTAGLHEAVPMIGSEPEIGEKDDEPELPAPADAAADLHDVTAPMADLPGGTAFGTLVHAVLEEWDAADPAALPDVCAQQLARYGPAELDAATLAAALRPALATPLGSLADDRTLAGIPATDRLAELEFELPLAGGDRPQHPARLGALAGVLRDHLPVDDPLAGYAEQLAEPDLGGTVLEGYLTGSIDAVLRVGERYLVVDYKTNRLGVPDRALTAWDYRADALAAAMRHAHYPLQALLYEIALHRYLRWRLAGYDPQRHLGGALYLFLRGMCGPDVRFADGTRPGVFAWRPPAALVVEASDVLAGGRA